MPKKYVNKNSSRKERLPKTSEIFICSILVNRFHTIESIFRSQYLEFLAKRAESESQKSCSSHTVSRVTESETLHGWVYVETEGGEAFFLEATSGKETLHGWVYVEIEGGEEFFLEATSGKKTLQCLHGWVYVETEGTRHSF